MNGTLSRAPSSVAQIAVRGVFVLGLRQVLVYGAHLLGSVALARLLSPAEYGMGAAATVALAGLLAFSGSGLGASLVREAGDPDERDYDVVFTAQQVAVAVAALAVWLSAPSLVRFVGRPAAEAWLFRLVALALVSSAWQAIGTARLERRLAFGGLAAVEAAQAVAFNGTAVALAWAGAGSLAIGGAMGVRALLGAGLITALGHWRPRWAWSWSRLRRHLAFALPFQAAGALSAVKDAVTPIVLGLVSGAAAVGYVGWAQMVAAYPVWALMILQRVYLPSFARLQDDRAELGRFLERMLFASHALVAPLATLTVALIDPIVRVVFGERWLPAVPAFYLLSIANVFVATATPLLGVLNALGRPRVALAFSFLWMAGTWVLGVPLILWQGALGFALANAVLQLTNLALVRVARDSLPFRIAPFALPVWGWAGAVALIAHGAVRALPPSRLDVLLLVILAALGTYATGVLRWRSLAPRPRASPTSL